MPVYLVVGSLADLRRRPDEGERHDVGGHF